MTSSHGDSVTAAAATRTTIAAMFAVSGKIALAFDRFLRLLVS
jgi:hypothetical protein